MLSTALEPNPDIFINSIWFWTVLFPVIFWILPTFVKNIHFLWILPFLIDIILADFIFLIESKSDVLCNTQLVVDVPVTINS